MTDVSEAPAVPPSDPGGDDRLGLLIAGGLLIVAGWGIAVALNLILHWTAPSGGTPFGPVRIYPTFGWYSGATFALGAVSGLLGAALIGLALRTERGPFVLPGFPY